MKLTGSLLVPAALILTLCSACSKTTPQPVLLAPPESLMIPCPEPQGAGDALKLLRKGDTSAAALAHVRYVLDTRDTLQLCNGRLSAIRKYVETMREAVDGN